MGPKTSYFIKSEVFTMTEKEKELIALFRYGLIAPLLNSTTASQKTHLDDISSKQHDVPHYGVKTYTRKTILEWHRNYRRYGFDALKPKVRTDKGSSRALPSESAKLLLNLRRENIHLSVKLFHEWLINQGYFTSSDCSYSTVYRLLKKHDLLKPSSTDTSDRRRFAHIDINTLWQTDVSHGPRLNLNGKKRKSFLIAFLDDASRRITGARFMLAEKNEDLLHVLKLALLTCGKPTMLYADNGKIFRSHQLNTSCATLGIALVNTKPYDPKSKGKIERFFKTVRSRFYPLLTDADLMDLEVLNQRFDAWLSRDYHHKVHSTIKEAPMMFYMRQSDKIKHFQDPRIIDEAFLIRVTRKVKSDATISLNNALYEASPMFIGKSVDLRFEHDSPHEVYIYENNVRIYTCPKVIMKDNAVAKRKNNTISYSSIGGSSNV